MRCEDYKVITSLVRGEGSCSLDLGLEVAKLGGVLGFILCGWD